MATIDLAKTLSYNYLFKDVPMDDLRVLCADAKVIEFHGGDTIVRQFDRSTDLYILLEGNAISKTFGGEIVAKFGPGSAIGEVSLLDGQPRSSNVVSVGASKALIIPGSAIEHMMNANIGTGYLVMRNLAQVLCRRLRAMNEYADSIQTVRFEPAGR